MTTVAGPGGAAGPGARPLARPARRAARPTPLILRWTLIGLVGVSLLWGAAAAWTVAQHASAAGDVVTTIEPLSVDAQQMRADGQWAASYARWIGTPVPAPPSARYSG